MRVLSEHFFNLSFLLSIWQIQFYLSSWHCPLKITRNSRSPSSTHLCVYISLLLF